MSALLGSLLAPPLVLPPTPINSTSFVSSVLNPCKLKLNEEDLGEDGAKAIAERLANNEPLQQLDLTSTSLSDDGAEAIFEALRVNTTLTELVLAENIISSKALRAAAPVLTMHNSTLRHLDLTCTEIGNEGARILAGILMLNTTLRTLTLRDAQIGDEGATALSKALRHNNTLEMLDLASNKFETFQLSELDRGTEHS